MANQNEGSSFKVPKECKEFSSFHEMMRSKFKINHKDQAILDSGRNPRYSRYEELAAEIEKITKDDWHMIVAPNSPTEGLTASLEAKVVRKSPISRKRALLPYTLENDEGRETSSCKFNWHEDFTMDLPAVEAPYKNGESEIIMPIGCEWENPEEDVMHYLGTKQVAERRRPLKTRERLMMLGLPID